MLARAFGVKALANILTSFLAGRAAVTKVPFHPVSGGNRDNHLDPFRDQNASYPHAFAEGDTSPASSMQLLGALG